MEKNIVLITLKEGVSIDENNIESSIMYSENDKTDTIKISMISSILEDIFRNGKPSEKDLDYDFDYIELYDNLYNLKKSINNIGF